MDIVSSTSATDSNLELKIMGEKLKYYWANSLSDMLSTQPGTSDSMTFSAKDFKIATWALRQWVTILITQYGAFVGDSATNKKIYDNSIENKQIMSLYRGGSVTFERDLTLDTIKVSYNPIITTFSIAGFIRGIYQVSLWMGNEFMLFDDRIKDILPKVLLRETT